MNNRISSILFVAGATLSTSSVATNGYQLIGIGSYQNSLAGAVTANPGSAMTAITNPAGMARIGKRADFSLEMFMPDRFVDFTAQGGGYSDSAAEQYGVPSLGWTAPIDEEHPDIFFGGGIYGTSGMGTDYPLTQYSAAAGPNPFDMYFEGYSSIQFWQMAPTLAWNVDKQLSFGISLNIDYQSVALKQAFLADTTMDGTPDTAMANLDLSRTAQAFGYGITLGVLYDLNDQITVGASYKSKQSFPDMEYQLSNGDIIGNSQFGFETGCPVSGPYNLQICPSGTYSMSLDFPEIISLGVAYTPIKPVTISFDVKHIKWSDTLSTLTITGPNGMRLDMPAGWDNQTVFAIGVEYALNEKVNLRAGYNQADAAIDNADTDSNYILPATVEKHYAIGGDYKLGKYWELGFHATTTSRETLNSSSPQSAASIGLKIQKLGLNLGYKF